MAFRYFPSIEHGSSRGGKRVWKGANRRWYITEKVDGSQLSLRWDGRQLRFFCRSSERKQEAEAEGSLFYKAMQMIKLKADQGVLNKSLVYHGETIADLRHSTLTYERTPSNFFIVFDVQEVNTGKWLNYAEMKNECDKAGLEVVPCLYQNDDESTSPTEKCMDFIRQIEEGKLKSCLGGSPEGVVLKHPCYNKSSDGNSVATKLKFVTKAFKERQHVKKPTERISPTDYLQWVGSMFDVPARLQKAQQHLKERNQPTSPQASDPSPHKSKSGPTGQPTKNTGESEATDPKSSDPSPHESKSEQTGQPTNTGVSQATDSKSIGAATDSKSIDTAADAKSTDTAADAKSTDTAADAKSGEKAPDPTSSAPSPSVAIAAPDPKLAATSDAVSSEKAAEAKSRDSESAAEAQLGMELDADLLKERRPELEAYIWAYLSRYVKALKNGSCELTGRLAEVKTDPVIQRLLLLGPNYEQQKVVETFLPDVCRAARKNILQEKR